LLCDKIMLEFTVIFQCCQILINNITLGFRSAKFLAALCTLLGRSFQNVVWINGINLVLKNSFYLRHAQDEWVIAAYVVYLSGMMLMNCAHISRATWNWASLLWQISWRLHHVTTSKEYFTNSHILLKYFELVFFLELSKR